MTPQSPQFGIVFVANDSAIEWVLPFLNSVREHNPAIPICLIPFDDNCRRLKTLQKRYNFLCFNDQRAFSLCDHISTLYHGCVLGYYRKYAAWSGPFDRFIYIDTDTIVTGPLDWLWPLLEDHYFVFSHSPNPGNRRHVWKDSVYSSGLLTTEEIEFSANAGFFAARRDAFTLEDILVRASSGLKLREHMVLSAWDQPLTNYLAVTLGKRITSLTRLRMTVGYPRLPYQYWAAQPGALPIFGQLYVLNRWKSIRPWSIQVFLVHWAGNNTKRNGVTSRTVDLLAGFIPPLKKIKTFRYSALRNYYANSRGSSGTLLTLADAKDLWRKPSAT
jgi:hypothetical protein